MEDSGMKRTLLELVQDILSALDADEVNSIDDTVEATQVATIIKNCYLNLASNRNWAGQKRLITFSHSGSPEQPTHLKTPDGIKELHLFNYNVTRTNDTVEYREVQFCHPDTFLRLVSHRGVDTPNTKVVRDFGGTDLVIITNKAPSYWTTFDDSYIVCDSYDSVVDDALKASKTQLHVTLTTPFRMVDDFVPDMPDEAFQSLYNEAKSIAFVELKQVANQKAEQEAVRQRTWLARKNWQLQGGVRYPNFGRRTIK